MSKDWYPYIDEIKCNGCLACLEFCDYDVFGEINSHGRKVYVKSKEKCVKGCKECKEFCMLKAIYFPDDIMKMVLAGPKVCNCGEHSPGKHNGKLKK